MFVSFCSLQISAGCPLLHRQLCLWCFSVASNRGLSFYLAILWSKWVFLYESDIGWQTKSHARSVNPSLGRWKLKRRIRPCWTSVLLPLPFMLVVPWPADVWFTPRQLKRGNWTVRYLVSGHPLNRCFCLIYEAGSVQLHGWSFFHAGWACLWMPAIGHTRRRDRVGSVFWLIARYKRKGLGSYFSWSHYLIICSLLIPVKPNDDILISLCCLPVSISSGIRIITWACQTFLFIVSAQFLHTGALKNILPNFFLSPSWHFSTAINNFLFLGCTHLTGDLHVHAF